MNLINNYLKYLYLTKSKTTIDGYKNDVSIFLKYMKNNVFEVNKTNAKKVELTHIYSFMYNIKKSNGESAVRRKLAALTSFFTYLVKTNVIKKNIMLDLDKDDKPKIPKRKSKYFNIDECKKLLTGINSRNIIRDKTMIILLLNTGLRLSELISLNVDIVGKESFEVIGKGNKQRTVYLSEQINNILKEYLEIRPNVKNENALFLSERKNRIGKSAVENAVRNAINNSKLNVDNNNDTLVHILRHSFGTNMYQSGTDIRTLQELLGHKNLSTTQIYVQVDEKQMIKQTNESIMNSII